MTDFTSGQRVKFRTPGRYPKDAAGVIESVSGGFLTVRCDDGIVRKSRPKAAALA